MVRTQRGNRGKDDRRHRGAERQMHHLSQRKALPDKDRGQDWHHDGTTADPEQTSEEARESAKGKISQQPGHISLASVLG
jgi:hypothetical protein